MERKSISEWIGGPAKNYESSQRRFLQLSVSDFFEYLEGVRRDGRARKTFEEISQYLTYKEDMRINDLLRQMYEILQANSGSHPDESKEARMYDWAVKVLFEVVIEPCHDLHIKGCAGYAEIMDKINKFSEGGRK